MNPLLFITSEDILNRWDELICELKEEFERAYRTEGVHDLYGIKVWGYSRPKPMSYGFIK